MPRKVPGTQKHSNLPLYRVTADLGQSTTLSQFVDWRHEQHPPMEPCGDSVESGVQSAQHSVGLLVVPNLPQELDASEAPLLVGTCDPLPHSRPWDESSFKAFFPRQCKCYIKFQGLPFFLASSVSCDVGTLSDIVRPGSGLLSQCENCLLPPPASVYYLFYLSGKRRFLATRMLDDSQ